MQFFKIKGTITNENWVKENDNKIDERSNIRKIAKRSREFNEKLQNKTDAFLFASDVTSDELTAGFILKNAEDIPILSERYAEALKLNVANISVEEITFAAIRAMLRDADRAGYIEMTTKCWKTLDWMFCVATVYSGLARIY